MPFLTAALIIFFCCAAGCTINLVCGFGFAVFVMMFLPYAVGTITAACIVNIVAIAQAAYILLKYRKSIRFAVLAAPLIAYAATNFITITYVGSINNSVLNRSLGAVLIALALYFFFAADRIKLKAGIVTGAAAGLISGVLNGLFSIGGPPAALYFSSVLEKREEYLATIQGYFFVSNIYSLVLRIYDGQVNTGVLKFGGIGIAGMALGTLIGTLVFKKVSDSTLRMLIYCMMIFSGAVMVVRG